MSSIRYLCLRIVLDITQVDSSQDSRTVKPQKKEFKNCKVRPIECVLQPIETRFPSRMSYSYEI